MASPRPLTSLWGGWRGWIARGFVYFLGSVAQGFCESGLRMLVDQVFKVLMVRMESLLDILSPVEPLEKYRVPDPVRELLSPRRTE